MSHWTRQIEEVIRPKMGYSDKIKQNYSKAPNQPNIRLGRKSNIANANVIDNGFFEVDEMYSTPVNKKVKNTQHVSSLDEGTERVNIYNSLIKKHSKFETEEIFNSAPNFFKDKLGISTNSAHEVKHTSSFHKDDPFDISNFNKFSRRNSCFGCSSKSRLKTSEDMQSGNRIVKKPLVTSNRSVSQTSIASGKNQSQKSILPRSVSNTIVTRCNRIPKIDPFPVSDLDSTSIIPKLRSGTRSDFQNVFAVNGSLIVIKGSLFENYTNWFAESHCVKHKFKLRQRQEGFPKSLDFSGFLHGEIHMKLSTRRELIIEAYRPASEISKVKRRKEIVELSSSIPIESLLASRTPDGKIYLEII